MFDKDKALWRAVRNYLDGRGLMVSDDIRIEMHRLAVSFYEDGVPMQEAVESAAVLVIRREPEERAG